MKSTKNVRYKFYTIGARCYNNCKPILLIYHFTYNVYWRYVDISRVNVKHYLAREVSNIIMGRIIDAIKISLDT